MIVYRPVGKIKAISFDLDDTLYDNQPLMRRAEQKLIRFMAERFAETADQPMAFWQQYKQSLLAANPALASDMGELRLRTLRLGFEALGYRGARLSQAASLCFEFFYQERSNFKVATPIGQLLSALAEHVPLVAITNGNVNLSAIGIDDCFQAVFKSSLQQPKKPHPMMFDLAQRALKLPAAQILHVGDSLHNDVVGARQAGFSSAWHACNRPMYLAREKATLLPDLVLFELARLKTLV